MAEQQFKLPDLGEGLTEGDLIKWTVAVGDHVEVNDTIAEVETVKAAVELPAPWAGTVTALYAAEGETVPVGAAIIGIDVPGTDAAPATAAAAAPTAAPTGDGEQQMTLVGYGPREEAGGRRRRHRPSATVAGAQASFNLPPGGSPPISPVPAPGALDEPASVEPTNGAAPALHAPAARASGPRALAKPPVRKLAKTLGVDLNTLTPTGPHGTVSRADVTSAAAGGPTSAPAEARRASSDTGGERETRIPIRGVRKHTAEAMVASAFTAPHVTEFLTADVTAMMELRERVAARREFRDVKITPLAFLARAVILAVRDTPEINSSWDADAGEIVQKHYLNLGIAAATERGLIVPNIKDAQALSLRDLAVAIGELSATARSGKTAPADMQGGTITITNVGVFGVDTGTPILNPGEAGIVAFGAVRRMPWVVDEQIVPRWVTQLAVSFDHRLVDGQQGSRFLADVAAILADPGMALL